jgi:hypothetical protein
LHCPKCPRPLEYVRVGGPGVQVYSCEDHGRFELGRAGLAQVNGLVYEPWTDREVTQLNVWQTYGNVHPFTCPVGGCHRLMEARTDGWHCPSGHFVQRWAHGFMLRRRP